MLRRMIQDLLIRMTLRSDVSVTLSSDNEDRRRSLLWDIEEVELAGVID